MKESGYYPPGAEFDPSAPYNQTDPTPKEVEVTVSITLSKTMRVFTTDYMVYDYGKDEDGNPDTEVDFSECNLEAEVKEQHYLPDEAGDILGELNNIGHIDNLKSKIRDLSGWTVDDFAVIME